MPPGSAAALFDDGYGRSGLAGLPNPISAIIDTDYASNKKDARQKRVPLLHRTVTILTRATTVMESWKTLCVA